MVWKIQFLLNDEFYADQTSNHNVYPKLYKPINVEGYIQAN